MNKKYIQRTQEEKTMTTENKTNENIVGKLDPATLARRLAQTRAEKARRFSHAEERRAREAFRAFAGPSPIAIVASKLSQELTAQREEAERVAATGKGPGGRFVKAPVREQAADTAAALTEFGF